MNRVCAERMVDNSVSGKKTSAANESWHLLLDSKGLKLDVWVFYTIWKA